MLFRRKPVNVEAFQWKGKGMSTDDPEWFIALHQQGDVQFHRVFEEVNMTIRTSFGLVQAEPSDWIVKGAFGVFVSKDGTFQTLFEPLGAEVVVGGEPKDHP